MGGTRRPQCPEEKKREESLQQNGWNPTSVVPERETKKEVKNIAFMRRLLLCDVTEPP